MDTTKRNAKLDPAPDISQNGNVTGSGPQNVRLRIQSQVLWYASKVFGAMLRLLGVKFKDFPKNPVTVRYVGWISLGEFIQR